MFRDIVELLSGGVARESPAGMDMSEGTEESTLLGAVTRQRLPKTEDFMFAAVVICRGCRSGKL
jgi:hypothetical protein